MRQVLLRVMGKATVWKDRPIAAVTLVTGYATVLHANLIGTLQNTAKLGRGRCVLVKLAPAPA